MQESFDHTRVRYSYLAEYALSLNLYTKRSSYFKNLYKVQQVSVSVCSFEHEPEIRHSNFSAKEKKGALLCSKPVFPKSEMAHSLNFDYCYETYDVCLFFLHKIEEVKELMAEHKEKIIKKRLSSIASTYEETLFQI